MIEVRLAGILKQQYKMDKINVSSQLYELISQFYDSKKINYT